MCSPSCVMAQRSRKWWEAGVRAQSRPLYGALELFSLFSAVLLLSKSATRSEEKRTSFQVNIFTYFQRCGDIQPSVGRRASGQLGQLKVDIWARALGCGALPYPYHCISYRWNIIHLTALYNSLDILRCYLLRKLRMNLHMQNRR